MVENKNWKGASSIGIDTRKEVNERIKLMKEYYKTNIKNIEVEKDLNNKYVIKYVITYE